MDFLYFEDKELTKQITDVIDLGKLKAGEKKQFTYYVLNSSVNPHDEVKFSVENEEVKVIFPEEQIDMKEKSSTKLILQWEPSIDIRRGLKTSIKVNSFEVLRG